MTEQLSLSLHDAISRHPVTNLQVLLSFFLGEYGAQQTLQPMES